MFSTAEKTNHSTTNVQKKAQQQTFFRKAGEESFFGGNKEQPSFFSAPVQAKLNVSTPDDPQEKEADAVADQVMRMPEPVVAAAPAAPAANKDDDKISTKEEEEKTIQPKIEAPCISTISCKEEEGTVQTKLMAKLFRMADEGYEGASADTGTVGITSGYINCKHTGLYRSDIIQRSGRGPPTGQIPFEQSLASSKGGGSALPSDTRQFMESRFNADFSGVRIHTDASARSMSSSIHAQAFAHGNDIYFNEGKFAPHTQSGGTLLAHELTHTIQQGASSTKGTSTVAPKIIARKANSIQRSADVPVQLTNAVAKAKTVEGKIDANKPGPDGNRTGWEHLLDIFKTTFGADKIVSGNGGTSVKGAVAEQDIKKKRETTGAVVDVSTQTDRNAIPKSKMGTRDAMPSWCGIFVFWALNKSGVPMPKWKLGERMIKPESARAPGVAPSPGDIAYRNAFSHYAIVDKVNGGTVTTVNGNTAGEDNLGGQVQTKDHPIADWTAFFNPLLVMQGNLGSGEGPAQEKPKTLRELRRELFGVNRKADEESEHEASGETVQRKEDEPIQKAAEDIPAETVQAKPELGTLAVNAGGSITTYQAPANPVAQTVQAKEEEQVAETESAETTAETKVHASLDVTPPATDSNSNNNTATPVIQTNATQEDVQTKEEEQQEEKTIAPTTIQTKQCDSCKAAEEGGEATAPQATATIQRKESVDSSNSSSSLTNEATGSSATTTIHERGPPVQVQTGSVSANNTVQCGWFDDAMSFVNDAIDFVAEGLEAGKRLLLAEARDFVMAIPGYKALRVVLGEDPITGEAIERTGHTFIEAAFDIMPGGRKLHEKLNELGALDEAAQWIDNGIAAVESLVSGVVGRVERFWSGLTLDSLASPSQIFEDAGNIIHSTINDIITFATNAAKELLEIVKRWLLDQVVGFIKEHTTAYPLLCVILGQDPITEQPVDRNGTNILSAILELGGEEGVQQRTQMQETGTFQKVADWIDRGIGVFSNLLRTIRDNFGLIWSIVSIDALMHPIDKFNEIYNTFAGPVRDVLKFMADTAIIILQFIKEVLMVRLSAWARTVRGYPLLTVLIGKDPFTNEKVPRNVPNIIRGFMSLMDGGEEQYQQMVESGAIGRATQRINAAVARLNMTPEGIIQLFTGLWRSFSLNDLAHPIEAFQRIIDTFGEPIGRLIAFVIEIVKIVIVVILEIMNFPFALINNIIAKAMLAFDLIKRDPIGFLKNLLRAIKEGFMQFFDKILEHLFNGLKAWFLSEVQAAGIPIPTDFTVMGIIKWLLAVLDITMEKIWKKLEDRIGKAKVEKIKSMISMAERVADAAGDAYAFMKDVQERGFMAVMVDKMKEQLSNVWEMVLDAVKGFVMDQIINKVTAKLLTMLDPTGIMAVVNSAIALYKAIQSFIKYLRQMLEIVNSFVEGTLQIAQGSTKKAADFLEGALARGIPIVIGFLANQVGLDLSGRLKEALEIVREKVDKALTWVIDKVVGLVERLVAFGREAVESLMNWLGLRNDFKSKDGGDHHIFFSGSEDSATMMMASNDPRPVAVHLEKKKDSDPNAAAAYAYFTSTVKVDEKDVEDKGKAYKALTDKTQKRAARYAHQQAVQKLRVTMKDFADKLALVTFDAANADLNTRTEVHKTADGGRAKSVTALPLTYLPGSEVGSAPGEDPPGWKSYAQNSSEQWVRGHLLSEHLHGPGKKWNMVPVNQSVNSSMAGVEAKAIPLIANQGKTYYYKTSVTYDDSRTDSNEKAIATSVSMEYGESTKKGDKFEKVDSTVKSFGPFTQTIPNFGGAPNLNDIGESKLADILKELSGTSKTAFARDVMMCKSKYAETDGGFNDINDVHLRMEAFYLGTLTPKANATFPQTIKQFASYKAENRKLMADAVLGNKLRIE